MWRAHQRLAQTPPLPVDPRVSVNSRGDDGVETLTVTLNVNASFVRAGAGAEGEHVEARPIKEGRRMWRGMEGVVGNIRARVQRKRGTAAQRRGVRVINARCWRHELGIGVAGNETGVVDALARGRFDHLCVGINAIEGWAFREEESVGLQIMV